MAQDLRMFMIQCGMIGLPSSVVSVDVLLCFSPTSGFGKEIRDWHGESRVSQWLTRIPVSNRWNDGDMT